DRVEAAHRVTGREVHRDQARAAAPTEDIAGEAAADEERALLGKERPHGTEDADAERKVEVARGRVQLHDVAALDRLFAVSGEAPPDVHRVPRDAQRQHLSVEAVVQEGALRRDDRAGGEVEAGEVLGAISLEAAEVEG